MWRSQDHSQSSTDVKFLKVQSKLLYQRVAEPYYLEKVCLEERSKERSESVRVCKGCCRKEPARRQVMGLRGKFPLYLKKGDGE